jgi:hypothetical protein
VVAAAIAAATVAYQLSHTKAKDRDEAWWANFRWATDRALPLKPGEEKLSLPLSLTILESMQTAAVTDLQRKACRGFIDHLAEKESSTKATVIDDAELRSQPAEGVALEEALSSYVGSSKNTAAASPAAQALLYEQQANRALRDAVENLKQPVGRVGVVIKYRSPGTKGLSTTEIMHEIDRQGYRRPEDPAMTFPLLVVSTAPVPKTVQDRTLEFAPATFFITWEPEDGADGFTETLMQLTSSYAANPDPLRKPIRLDEGRPA